MPDPVTASAIIGGVGTAASVGSGIASAMNQPKPNDPYAPVQAGSLGAAPIEGAGAQIIPLRKGQQTQPKYAAIQEMLAQGGV